MRFFNLPLLVSVGTALAPFAVLALLVALNNGTDESGLGFRNVKWLLLFWCSAAGLAALGGLLAIGATVSTDRKQQVLLPFLASLVAIASVVGVLEVALRLVAVDGPLGQRIGSMEIKPYDWSLTSRNNLRLVENSKDSNAYYVGHPTFGWGIGESRSSADGLYASSVEGLRSPVAGKELASQTDRPRIALYGDSFIFSEEVGFSDSLAFHMEQLLVQGHQVLNFGVPGYGIDQALLRFLRSSDSWRPRVAVLGFIRHDLVRAMNVYTFLRPSWGIPFSKPRYILAENAVLRLENVPNLPASEVYAAEHISALPLIALDPNYHEFDWQWRIVHRSMLYRLLASILPRYPEADPAYEDNVAALGARIIHEFVSHARTAGIVPIVVYLPSRSDFSSDDLPLKRNTTSKAAEFGVDVVDLTACITDKVEYDDLFVEGGVHYSGDGNKAFADCLIGLLPRNDSSSAAGVSGRTASTAGRR